jgi:hypothetical protein
LRLLLPEWLNKWYNVPKISKANLENLYRLSQCFDVHFYQNSSCGKLTAIMSKPVVNVEIVKGILAHGTVPTMHS